MTLGTDEPVTAMKNDAVIVSQTPSAGGKILLVDDDAALLDLLCELCEVAGFDYVKAGNGFEALDRLDTNGDISAVILDVMMPGIDGYQVCSKIKLDRRRNRLPVIMLTAKDAYFDELKGYRVGADAYVTKPFKIDELLDTVRAKIDEANNRRHVSRLDIELENEVKFIREINRVISELFFISDFNSEEIADLQICLHELSYNAIEHGNRFDADKKVFISCILTDRKIEIRVRDEGAGFDLAEIANPTMGDNLFKPRGRGLFLTRRLMDEVKVDRESKSVTFTKFIRRNLEDGPLPMFF